MRLLTSWRITRAWFDLVWPPRQHQNSISLPPGGVHFDHIVSRRMARDPMQPAMLEGSQEYKNGLSCPPHHYHATLIITASSFQPPVILTH